MLVEVKYRMMNDMELEDAIKAQSQLIAEAQKADIILLDGYYKLKLEDDKVVAIYWSGVILL